MSENSRMARRYGRAVEKYVDSDLPNEDINNKKMKPKKKKKKKCRFLRIFSALLVLFILIAGILIFFFGKFAYSSLNELSSKIYKPIETSRTVDLKDEEPVSILLLGVDQREGDKGRSDTMILLTINPEEETTNMLSIPRDTYVEIPGYDDDKINHAYAYGGEQLAVQTVEGFLEVPVDYYIKLNFEGFAALIDAIGGITVDVKYEVHLDGTDLYPGVQHLNGKQALDYCRQRYDTSEGDFSRQEAQQDVIEATIDQLISFDTIKNMDEIIAALGDHMTTNLTSKDMWYLATGYLPALKNVNNMQIEATGDYIDGASVQIVSEDERLRISEELNTHLDL